MPLAIEILSAVVSIEALAKLPEYWSGAGRKPGPIVLDRVGEAAVAGSRKVWCSYQRILSASPAALQNSMRFVQQPTTTC